MRYNISQNRIEQRIANMNSVYEAIYKLGGIAMSNQIKSYLKHRLEKQNGKKIQAIQERYQRGEIQRTERDHQISKLTRPITAKTIQRCAREDLRIEGDGNKYWISDKSRLELKNLDPEWSGLEIFRGVMRRHLPEDLDGKVKEFIKRIGAFVFFTFIESSRPFDDSSFTLADREYLAKYWSQQALPIDDMYTMFRANFGHKRKQNWTKPMAEMNDKDISDLLERVKTAFPLIYSDLASSRLQASSRKEISK